MLTKIQAFGSMIKFSHTIFALPFALSGAVLALNVNTFDYNKIIWIMLAMIGARTAAMGFNRIIDSKIDAANPRTKDREIPAGKISVMEASIYVILSSALLVFSAFMLNDLCFYLSPVALIVVLGYSVTKRFTALCHIVLGIGLSLAPIGAWLAITNEFALLPILIGSAVLFWVSGFDIVYACQDYEYDKSVGLHSIPVMLGPKKTLILAKIFHVIALGLFSSAYFVWDFSIVYPIGLFLIASLMTYEHRLVKPNDFKNIDMAFFGMNGTISMIFFATILLDFFEK